MRFVGALSFAAFAAAAFYCVALVFRSRRPRDVIFAALATVCAVISVIGLVVAFVPDFLN